MFKYFLIPDLILDDIFSKLKLKEYKYSMITNNPHPKANKYNVNAPIKNYRILDTIKGVPVIPLNTMGHRCYNFIIRNNISTDEEAKILLDNILKDKRLPKIDSLINSFRDKFNDDPVGKEIAEYLYNRLHLFNVVKNDCFRKGKFTDTIIDTTMFSEVHWGMMFNNIKNFNTEIVKISIDTVDDYVLYPLEIIKSNKPTIISVNNKLNWESRKLYGKMVRLDRNLSSLHRIWNGMDKDKDDIVKAFFKDPLTVFDTIKPFLHIEVTRVRLKDELLATLK